MIIKKKNMYGDNILVEIVLVEKYKTYCLYDVYRVNDNGTKNFLYKTCFTNLQLKEIEKKGFIEEDEEMEDNI